MAIFTIKPSRGTIVFLVLLAVALCIRYGLGKQAEHVTKRDTPHIHSVRKLLQCVLGRDATRLLESQLVKSNTQGWEPRISERLQRIVSVHYDASWPARCIPIAERLEQGLEFAPEAHRARDPAREVVRILNDAVRGPLSAIEHVEDGSLATQLASLAFEIVTLSDGAQREWTSGAAPAATDLFPVREFEIPQPVLLPPGVEYPTFVHPGLLLYQNALDGQVHQVVFNDAGQPQADRPIGYGAPVAGTTLKGATLIAGDDGDMFFLTVNEPARLVGLPEMLRSGTEVFDDWAADATPNYFWLLTNDGGVLRVRNVPRTGEPRWSTSLASIGDPESFVGGTLMANPTVPDSVWVLGLRRLATGVALEKWPVAAVQPQPSTRPAQGSAKRGRPSRLRSKNTNALDARDASETLISEWPVFNPHIVQCASGASHYLLVTSDDQLSAIAIRNQSAERVELLDAAWNASMSSRIEFSCNERAALLFTDLAHEPGELVYFDFDSGRAYKLAPPRFGVDNRAHTIGGALTDHFGVVALVDNGTTVRSYRLSQPTTSTWDGGTLLAMPHRPDDHLEGVYTLGVTAVTMREDRVAVLVEVQVGNHRALGRLLSQDGGMHWR